MRTTQRKVKSGRLAKDDDPGSDSEYEEVDASSWEAREELQHRTVAMSPQIYLDEGSTSRALLEPRDMHKWASDNATLTFAETENAQLGVGMAVQALVAHERERGLRREERCIQVGENVEIVAEACLRDGQLVLQEPSRASSELHRVDSDSFVRASALVNKVWLGAVLRDNRSLEAIQKRGALMWRIGKWLSGLLLLWAVSPLLRRAARKALAASRRRERRAA